MSDFPAAGYLSDAVRTTAEMKAALEEFLAASKQLPGGGAVETLTVSANTITPAKAVAYVTPSSGATATLNTIGLTNLPDGSLLMLIPVSGKTITFTHAAGGSGQISFPWAANTVISNGWLLLRREGTTWIGVQDFYNAAADARSAIGAAAAADLSAHAALTNNPHSVTALQIGVWTPGMWYTSTPGTGETFVVPSAVTKIFVDIVGGGGGGGGGGGDLGGSNGSNGNPGIDSYIKRASTTLISAAGGPAGSGGLKETFGNGGDGGAADRSRGGQYGFPGEFGATRNLGGSCQMTPHVNVGRGGQGGQGCTSGSFGGGGGSGGIGIVARNIELAVTPGESLTCFAGNGGGPGIGGGGGAGNGEVGYDGVVIIRY